MSQPHSTPRTLFLTFPSSPTSPSVREVGECSREGELLCRSSQTLMFSPKNPKHPSSKPQNPSGWEGSPRILKSHGNPCAQEPSKLPAPFSWPYKADSQVSFPSRQQHHRTETFMSLWSSSKSSAALQGWNNSIVIPNTPQQGDSRQINDTRPTPAEPP